MIHSKRRLTSPKVTRVQSAFLSTLDPGPDRWTEVLTEEHRTAAALERKGVIELRKNGPHWEAHRLHTNLLDYMIGT